MYTEVVSVGEDEDDDSEDEWQYFEPVQEMDDFSSEGAVGGNV